MGQSWIVHQIAKLGSQVEKRAANRSQVEKWANARILNMDEEQIRQFEDGWVEEASREWDRGE